MHFMEICTLFIILTSSAFYVVIARQRRRPVHGGVYLHHTCEWYCGILSTVAGNCGIRSIQKADVLSECRHLHASTCAILLQNSFIRKLHSR